MIGAPEIVITLDNQTPEIPEGKPLKLAPVDPVVA